MANRFWVGGTGTWDDTSTANWSATSGGAAGASAPTNADAAIFDANSGTAALVTVAATATCASCTVNKSDINLSLSGSCTFAGAFTLTTGTLTLNTYVLTCATVSSSNSNARTIDFGTGKIVITGSTGTIWSTNTITNLVISGAPLVDVTHSGATAVTIASGSLPEASSISFNILAGTYALTIANVRDLNFTGFAGSVVSSTRTIWGSLTLSSTMTITGTSTTTFGATSGNKTIASNGTTLDIPIVFNGVGGTWTLSDSLTVGSARTVTLSNGTFNADNNNVSLGAFALGSGTKTLVLGSGTWTVTGTSWNANTNSSGLTVSSSTGTISMVSSSAKTFAGGGRVWPSLNQGGSGALTIQQNNTFANITNSVQPATITLTSGTTQTVTTFTASGTSGNLITLNASTAGSRATLTDSGGVNSVSYMDIKDIAATGYGEWQAYTSDGNVDSGNNLGWVFAEPPPLTASEYQISLKSFTERRSF